MIVRKQLVLTHDIDRYICAPYAAYRVKHLTGMDTSVVRVQVRDGYGPVVFVIQHKAAARTGALPLIEQS